MCLKFIPYQLNTMVGIARIALGRQSFDDFVLPYRFKGQMYLHRRDQHLAHAVNRPIDAFNVIGDVAKIHPHFLGNSRTMKAHQLLADIDYRSNGAFQQ